MSMHIELGHALITMVEPNRDTIQSYNRWYEHDHFLSGVLTGPGAFAGRRFVATRALKDLRLPDDSPIARPLDDGSFVTVYWIERDQLAAHCAWGFPEAARLASLGRMNTDRHHVSTSYYDLDGVTARDERPVPVELALHHPYPAVVMVWTANGHGDDPSALRSVLTAAGSPVGQVVSLRAIDLPEPLPAMPGAIIGDDAARAGVLAHCCFVEGDVAAQWPAIASLIRRAVDESGTELLLAAPFVPTVPGTDAYLDELW